MGWFPRIDVEPLRQRWLRWRRWLVLHLGWWRTDLVLLGKRAVSEFLDDHCAQLAASMSYYVFFSLFPLAILVVSIAGVLLTDDGLRDGGRGRIVRAAAAAVGGGAKRTWRS